MNPKGEWEEDKHGVRRKYEKEGYDAECGETTWKKGRFGGGKRYFVCELCGFRFVKTYKKRKGNGKNPYLLSVVE